jgi:multidrug resistance efflux pump
MKQVLICLLLALAGCKPGADKDDNAAAAKKPPAEFAVERDAAGETIVSLSPETQKRIDLKVAALEPAERQPELIAYGSVLDPASLAALHGEIALDQAALEAAQKVTQRAKALFEQDENVARKTLEAAQNDERAAEIKLRAAERSLALEWGGPIASLHEADRRDLVAQIAAHHTK